MLEAIVTSAFGLVMLIVAGDFLVKGAISLSGHLKVSSLIVGLTVVAFGTSVPELFTVSESVMAGYPDLAIGNVIGSNIANILLVIGVTAMVSDVLTDLESAKRSTILMLAVTAIFVGMSHYSPLDWRHGAILLALLFTGLYFAYRIAMRERSGDAAMPRLIPRGFSGRRFAGLMALIGGCFALVPLLESVTLVHAFILLGLLCVVAYSIYTFETVQAEVDEEDEGLFIETEVGGKPYSVQTSVLFIVGSFVALPGGGYLFVNGVAEIGETMEISLAFMGLSLAAVATSLPELAASVMAAVRKHSEVALGNIIGSNIFNILSVLGIATFFGEIETGMVMGEIWFMAMISLLLLPFTILKVSISKMCGIVFVTAYFAFLYFSSQLQAP